MRIAVRPDGTVRVASLAESEGGARVVGVDPDQTTVTLLPGQQTAIVPGQPPAPPAVTEMGSAPSRPSDAEARPPSPQFWSRAGSAGTAPGALAVAGRPPQPPNPGGSPAGRFRRDRVRCLAWGKSGRRRRQ